MAMWQATDDGYFFPRSEDLSAAVQAKLQTLILEDAAQSVSAFDSDERLYRLEKL